MTIEMLTLFAQSFDINIVSNIDNATVLIVKTFEENAFYRSENTGHAIIKHMPIVTLKWVVQCLKVNTLVDFVRNLLFSFTQNYNIIVLYIFCL